MAAGRTGLLRGPAALTVAAGGAAPCTWRARGCMVVPPHPTACCTLLANTFRPVAAAPTAAASRADAPHQDQGPMLPPPLLLSLLLLLLPSPQPLALALLPLPPPMLLTLLMPPALLDREAITEDSGRAALVYPAWFSMSAMGCACGGQGAGGGKGAGLGRLHAHTRD